MVNGRTYIEQELHPAVAIVSNPSLERKDLEKVVPQDDDLNSHCREVKDWIKHDNLADVRNVLEVLVE